MVSALVAIGLFVVGSTFVGLAVVGRRDAKAGVAPDLLPEDLRASLGLWSEANVGEGAARAEGAFLSPQFLNSRRVLFNSLIASLCFGTGLVVAVVSLLS